MSHDRKKINKNFAQVEVSADLNNLNSKYLYYLILKLKFIMSGKERLPIFPSRG